MLHSMQSELPWTADCAHTETLLLSRSPRLVSAAANSMPPPGCGQGSERWLWGSNGSFCSGREQRHRVRRLSYRQNYGPREEELSPCEESLRQSPTGTRHGIDDRLVSLKCLAASAATPPSISNLLHQSRMRRVGRNLRPIGSPFLGMRQF
jgi:hypothetical protein